MLNERDVFSYIRSTRSLVVTQTQLYSIHMILKLKMLTILCLTICRYLLFGRANKKNPDIKKVIIFQSGKIGDSICATPVFRAVKRKYPDCKVVVVGKPLTEIIHQYNTDVDSFIVYDEHTIFDTIRKVRAEQADFACLVSPGAFALAVLFLSGIPLIVVPRLIHGWSPYETKTYKIMSRFVVTAGYMMGNYIPREYLKVLEPIHIFTDDTKKYVFWSKDAKMRMHALVSDTAGKYRVPIGIMPGAGNRIKQWPAERFAEVANHLISKHNAHIFVIGDDSNREEIDTMLSSLEDTAHVTDSSRITVDELKALVSEMYMTVSVDTGPVFIAEATGVPTIDIGGVIHPHDISPNDGIFHIFITYDGEPLLWSLNARVYDREKVRKGMESVTVQKVIEKVDELVENIKKRAPNHERLWPNIEKGTNDRV